MQDLTDAVEVSTTVDAPPSVVWGLVADVTRMGEWSPETHEATWTGGAIGPVVGATFTGRNRLGGRSWTTRCRITEATPGRSFAFAVSKGPFRVAEWRYDLEPAGGGCVVTESVVDRRGGVMHAVAQIATGVTDRATHNRRTMTATLAELKAAAEAAPGR